MISIKQVADKAREYSNKVFDKFYPKYLSPENFKLRSKNDFQAGYEQALIDTGLITEEYYASNIESSRKKYRETIVELDKLDKDKS